MNCTCITDLENKVTAMLIEQGRFKKPIKRVEMQGVTLKLLEGSAVSATVNVIEIELEGQKKLEKINMFHSYCPFCGVSQAVKS